jgi:hypothetical protein
MLNQCSPSLIRFNLLAKSCLKAYQTHLESSSSLDCASIAFKI